MNVIWFYSILSVLIVSLMSFIGVFTLSIKAERLKTILIYFISFSAGALFGDIFIHLLPEVAGEGLGVKSSVYILFGIVIFFFLEKVIKWKHCHMPLTKTHVHSFAYMSLVGDGVHNFIDGMIIAASFMVSLPVGFATAIAVVLHEIPQEIGDFGILLHGGFSKSKALLWNFASALTAVLGAIFTLILGEYIQNLQIFLIAIAMGGFIYIAGSDLIPEMHKETGLKESILQIIYFLAGIGIMFSLLLVEF